MEDGRTHLAHKVEHAADMKTGAILAVTVQGADLDGERQKVKVFCMRSMGSGGAFHRAYPRATQQAFLEGHELGFRYFGGVFGRLRYDNLTSAVKKILRGYRREETERFIAVRSHWKFRAEFCTLAEGHEKGGVEGEAGYFRHNHLVPVPQARDLADLNRQLLAGCRADEGRKIGDRAQTVGEGMQIEHALLLALSAEGFLLAEDSFPRIDSKGCVRVRNNFYSAPIKAGTSGGPACCRRRWKSGTTAATWCGMSAAMEAASSSSIWNIIWRCWSGSRVRWPGASLWSNGGDRADGRPAMTSSGKH